MQMPKKEYQINPFLRFMVDVWMGIFKPYYGIRANISPKIKYINEPYLLLSNHLGRYDPFIISSFLKKKPHFISSDAILRDRVIGRLFKGLGAVPKKKGMRDSVVIREMMQLVKRGDSIALFPEGTRTWDGTTLPIEPSIVKLVRLLNVPVIICKMKGAYAFDPRWSKSLRPADVEIDYELCITKEEIKNLNDKEVFKIIINGLMHDDIAYQEIKMTEIKSEHRAEYIDRVLFQCQYCESFDGFNSERNSFICRSCGKKYDINKYGFFESSDGPPKYADIKSWLIWQNKNFTSYIKHLYISESEEVFFADHDVRIERAHGDSSMLTLGTGDIRFFNDRLELEIDGEITGLELSEIQSIGPQFNERIEFYYQEDAYRFVDTKLKVSGLKWELAANEVWKLTDLDHKLSTYLKEQGVNDK